MRLFLFAVSGTILPAPDDRSKIEAAIAVFRIQCCWYAPRADIVSTIAEWLKSLGLSQYTDCFVENGIDVSVLPDLTDQDLKDLGDLFGHFASCCVRSAISAALRMARRRPPRLWRPSQGETKPSDAS